MQRVQMDFAPPPCTGRTSILVAAAALAALGLMIYSGSIRAQQQNRGSNNERKRRPFPRRGGLSARRPPHRNLFCPAIRRHSAMHRSMREPVAISSAGISTLRACPERPVARGDRNPRSRPTARAGSSDLDTAQANLNIAKITATRWQDLVSNGSFPNRKPTGGQQSQRGEIRGRIQRRQRARLEQLQSFEKIYAPLTGSSPPVVRTSELSSMQGQHTTRNSFTSSPFKKLRLYVSVPEVYSRAARSGAPATLTLDEFPGQTFHALCSQRQLD